MGTVTDHVPFLQMADDVSGTTPHTWGNLHVRPSEKHEQLAPVVGRVEGQSTDVGAYSQLPPVHVMSTFGQS